MYFEAKVPGRLLRSNEIPMGTLFCVDGISTGAVFLHVQGISVYVPKRPADLSRIELSRIKIYRIFGSNVAQPQPGIRGATTVEDDSFFSCFFFPYFLSICNPLGYDRRAL